MSRFHRKGGITHKDKEQLYRLIIGQLKYDGFETAAAQLSEAVPKTVLGSSERLGHLVKLGMQTEGGPSDSVRAEESLTLKGIDLEYENDEVKKAISPSVFEWVYNTVHKGPVWAAAFSRDGGLAATASADTTIKLMDVERVSAKSHQSTESHPVLRTLYDHTDGVISLDFHPTAPILASGSKDCTIKFFHHSKPAVKRASFFIQEVARVNSIAFHPSGDFILAGTDQPTLRLYDTSTFQCYVSANAKDQHTGPVTSVHYTSDGRMYVSSSRDGRIRVWDGVSNRCISVFPKAHAGAEVTSVKFSRNSKYILSSGRDGCAILWELAAGRPLNYYTSPGRKHTTEFPTTAAFTHTEDYVLLQDDRFLGVNIWDTRTTELLKPIRTGHTHPVRCICHSPNKPVFITTSDDFRIKFWMKRELMIPR